MSGRLLFYMSALSLLGFTACKTAAKLDRPVETYVNRPPTRLSTLNIPVKVNVKELETTLNRQLTGVLYKDDNLNDGDNMMLRAVKREDIRLLVDSQSIRYQVPLILWVRYDAGITDLEADGDITVEMKTTFQVRSDWQLETQTELVGHHWTRQPKLRMGAMQLPLGTLLDVFLQSSQRYLTRNIDDLVRNSLNLQNLIGEVWQQLFQPVQVSEEYNAWLTANPQRLGMTPLRAESNSLSSTIVVEFLPEINLGSMPMGRVPLPLPDLVIMPASLTRDSSVLHIDTEISYSEAERIAAEQLVGETFSSGKRSVRVEGVEIYGSGNSLIVNTSLSGSYNGNVYLEGTPVYNSRNNTIEVKNLNFSLSTKNVLYKSAAWLLKSSIRRQIEDNMQFLLKYNLEDMKNQLQQQLQHYPIMEGVTLSGQLQQLNIENVYLTPESVGVEIGLVGKINLYIQGVNWGN